MLVKNMTVSDIRSLAGGTIFSATFRKKDGSIRKMNCRIGVVKHLRGGVSTTAHKENLLSVWDLQAEGYRTINADTLLSLKARGKEYEVIK